MPRINALFRLTITPILFFLSMFWLYLTRTSPWILLIVTAIICDRLRREIHKVYSESDHWIFAGLLSLVLFLFKQDFSGLSLVVYGVHMIVIAWMFQYALPVRRQTRQLLKQMANDSDREVILIRPDRIQVDNLSGQTSILANGILKQKEMEWLSLRLILKYRDLVNHTVSVVVDEKLGRIETIRLSR